MHNSLQVSSVSIFGSQFWLLLRLRGVIYKVAQFSDAMQQLSLLTKLSVIVRLQHLDILTVLWKNQVHAHSQKKPYISHEHTDS